MCALDWIGCIQGALGAGGAGEGVRRRLQLELNACAPLTPAPLCCSAPPAPVAALLSPVLWQLNGPDRFDMYR